MKRRSFLAMLGLAPIAGVAAAKATPDTTDAIVKATAPDSALALRCANVGSTSVGLIAENFAIARTMSQPWTFDPQTRCLVCRPGRV